MEPQQPDSEAKRKPGRPRKIAPWYKTDANTIGDGTTLRMALIWNGIQLTRKQIRLLYKNPKKSGVSQDVSAGAPSLHAE